MKYLFLQFIFLIILQIIFNSSFFVFFDGNILYAQPYPYQKYQDRKEGITKSKNLVGGVSKIDLISALIENPDSTFGDDSSDFHLSFYLADDIRAKIVVEEFEKSYRLELLQKDFTSGSFNFSWPSEIARHYNIALEDFSPLAQVIPLGQKKIIPVLIYTRIPSEFEIKYRFVIVPYSAVKILEYSIYTSDSSKLIYSAGLRDLTAERPTDVSWNGLNKENKKVQSGQYDLVFETIFESLPGTIPDTVTTTYHFYHYTDLLEELAESENSP